MVFIEYYISYTGANVGPNGNIRPNKQLKRVCFLFSLANYSETCEQECTVKYGILEIVAHV